MQGTFCFMVGLVLAVVGAAGVDQSITDASMIESFAVSLIGCGVLACGVMIMNRETAY